MKNPPFVIEYPVQLNDISIDAKMRSWAVFNYLQDAAGRHADQLGLGLKQLRESDLSWVLSRIRVKMDSFPEYGDILRITTYPSGFDRLFAYRQFILSSAEDGRIFGYAGSAWLTLNPANYRPVSPAKYLTGLPQWEFEGDTFFQGEALGKLSASDHTPEMPQEHRISSTYIDYNRHLNNTYYAMFTEDWLGEKSKSPVRMKEIQINFNHTTGYGETLKCSGNAADGMFYVEGELSSCQKNAFQAQGCYEIIDFHSI